MKNKKAPKSAHTDNNKKGLGDYYGTGVRAKIGRVREDMISQNISSRNLRKPPQSLA